MEISDYMSCRRNPDDWWPVISAVKFSKTICTMSSQKWLHKCKIGILTPHVTSQKTRSTFNGGNTRLHNSLYSWYN